MAFPGHSHSFICDHMALHDFLPNGSILKIMDGTMVLVLYTTRYKAAKTYVFIYSCLATRLPSFFPATAHYKDNERTSCLASGLLGLCWP